MSQDARKYVYLDYAATTPVDPEVVLAMQPYWREKFGNAGSVHIAGQEARKAVDGARMILQDFLGAKTQREIIFTGSATEANNIGILGVLSRFAFHHGKKVHAITTMIEHSSILEPFKNMEARGIADVTYLKPDTEGIISPEHVKGALRDETVLVSIGYANNEIGVIQDISAISKIIKEARSKKKEARKQTSFILNSKFLIPYFHTDAVQAAQFLEMNVDMLGVDLLALSAHKLYGPKGIGALYMRGGVELEPLMYGGGQEYGIRPSTENVPFIVGFGRAIQIARDNKEDGISERIKAMRDRLLEKIIEIAPGVEVNGSLEKRLPNNINISFPEKDAETLLIGFSEQGICVSSGAACSSRAHTPSHVIRAIGKTEKAIESSIRITLGKETTENDIHLFIEACSKLLYNT